MIDGSILESFCDIARRVTGSGQTLSSGTPARLLPIREPQSHSATHREALSGPRIEFISRDEDCGCNAGDPNETLKVMSPSAATRRHFAKHRHLSGMRRIMSAAFLLSEHFVSRAVVVGLESCFLVFADLLAALGSTSAKFAARVSIMARSWNGICGF